MGTSTNPAQFGNKLQSFAKDLNNPKPALTKVGMEGKKIFGASAAAAGILGRKPTGHRKAVTAYYDIKGGHAVLIGYRGAIHLIANPTKAHDIYPRSPRGRGARRRGRGAQALTINGDLRASAHHPGTRGKPVIREARKIAARELPPIFQRAAISEPLHKAFR